MLKKIYPEYFFIEVSMDDIEKLDEKTLKFPFSFDPANSLLPLKKASVEQSRG